MSAIHPKQAEKLVASAANDGIALVFQKSQRTWIAKREARVAVGLAKGAADCF